MDVTDPKAISDRAEWRDWLISNHSTEKECWITCSSDEGCVSYLDAVEEALCFGWIDSTVKLIDGKRVQRFSPRRKNSNWTELNKERVRRLRRLGLMTEAGEKALPDMDETFIVDTDIMERILKDQEVHDNFRDFPELYIKVRLSNISGYKVIPEEFEKKLSRFLDHTRRNKMYGEWNDKGRLL